MDQSIKTCFTLIKICVWLLILLSISLLVFSCSSNDASGDDIRPPMLSQEQLISRGKYLVTTSACNDCHSPKVMTPEGPMPDTSRLLSGHPREEKLPPMPKDKFGWVLFNETTTAFVGPWGVSYSANLTPDATGIEAWTLENFKTAIRKGKYKGMEGGRNLLPPMPVPVYRNFTDSDIEAIFVYLKSIKPVDNLVPTPISPEDLNK
jgi:hypothetical protein